MKKNKPNGVIILVAVIAAMFIIATHGQELNRIPGIQVKTGEVSVDFGGFHYSNGKG